MSNLDWRLLRRIYYFHATQSLDSLGTTLTCASRGFDSFSLYSLAPLFPTTMECSWYRYSKKCSSTCLHLQLQAINHQSANHNSIIPFAAKVSKYSRSDGGLQHLLHLFVTPRHQIDPPDETISHQHSSTRNISRISQQTPLKIHHQSTSPEGKWHAADPTTRTPIQQYY